MVRLLVEDVTLGRDQNITAHIRLKGGQAHTPKVALPPPVWQARQTNPDTFKPIDQLLDEHTDAQTAELLNQAGRRTGTGQPFTALSIIRLRQDHRLPSHRNRLRARGLLTVAEMAHRLGVHTSTIKNWHAAGLLTGHKANEQDEQLAHRTAPGHGRAICLSASRSTLA
jgi:DNA-binding transcriptional regulator YiaG